MSKRFMIWGFVFVLVAAMSGLAVADVPQGNHDAINLIDHLTANAAPAPAEAQRVNLTSDYDRSATADAGCQSLTNSCLIGFYIWSVPGTANARIALSEGFDPDPGFLATPCSIKTVSVVIYDWIDPAIMLDVDITVHADDGAGLPGAELATITVPAATADADIIAGVFTTVDFSPFNIVIPAGERFHVVVDVPTATPGTSGIFTLSDGGTDDAAACPEGAANANGGVFYTDVGVWESHDTHFGGFQFGSFFIADVCCEAPPPDCFSLTNSCLIGFYIWSVPGTANARIALGEGFDLDPTGSRECTLKTASVVFYDWIDPAIMVDCDVSVWDDAGGLPGTELARVTIPAATVDADIIAGVFTVVDFSAFNLTAPPGGRLHVVMDAPTATPGVSGFFALSDGGTDDAAACPEGAGNTRGSVFYTDVGVWESHDTHFGGFQFGTFIIADICCPPLLFDLCTPASDLDWATQGNGYGRTNATNASLSSLCGVNLAWTAEPGGDVQTIQPIIADDKVLVTHTDALTCYDKATGGVLWTFGGFPYIVGDLRGSPTVEGGAVYVGGGGAQAFTKLDLATGAILWSRNLGGPDVPLLPGQTNWTPSVVSGGAVYFTQETGNVYKLDDATGADLAGSPLAMPDAPGAVPYNALTSDGTKLWVGTADAVGTAGNIHQIDAATMAIDWTLSAPGNKFYPAGVGDPVFDPYSPEGFPGSMAYEGGILYYHSQIRNDGNGFLHFPATGAVGAIDVATEDGTGAGILWVNDAQSITAASPGLTPAGSYDFSGPAVGPGIIYTTSRGFFGGTTEQDGVAAWSKTLGTRLWYQGYQSLGVSGGVGVQDDARCDAPATVFCQPDGTPYVFTGHVGGQWRLTNGNTGEVVWYRTFTDRVRGTAIADDCVATVTRTGGPGAGGGAVSVFLVGPDRPRMQIDSQFVFRTATPGDGLVSDNIVDALQNRGCIDLNIASYGTVNPPAVRITGVSPVLASATKAASRNLQGYDALLDVSSAKGRMIAVSAGIETDDVNENMARTFANNATGALDPLFLTVTQAPGAVAAGATQSIAVDYDETGLTNNTGYTNYIEVASDDVDYYPQGLVEAVAGLTTPGVPAIQFELFIGCPDAEAVMTVGLGEIWVNNFGAGAGGGSFNDPGSQNFVVNGNDANMFDGGWALVVQDSVHWAFDGCSVSGYPRRAGEFGPTLPCGLTINANSYDSPLGVGVDAVEEVAYNMLDLASTNGFFAPSSRPAGGVFMNVQRVASQDATFGDFVLTAITLTNEVGDFGDIVGDLNDVYFGGVTDWDISGSDNLKQFADGYGQTDGGGGGWGAGNWISGHVRLDGAAVGAGGIGSGGAPTFMAADIQDDQGHGNQAFNMMSDPANYCATIDPASCDNTDLAALWSIFYEPTLTDGSSVTFYHAIYQVENGANGNWADAATADAAYAEVTCRAKAFAGFGKGDVTCDGVIDLQDVVALGNIVDGLLDPAGTGGVYTADADGDNDYDNDDYNLLYDVVAGVQPASALANSWRF